MPHATGVSGVHSDNAGGPRSRDAASEEVRIDPVGGVVPVVVLIIRLRADDQVLRVDAEPVVTPVADDVVA
ncbi:hypothetical protein RZ517_05880 [Roseovarius sp. S88]|uniref:Uncharacterized protein n=1 Tax=Roseovarius phycicola TaxID=3080976 RepID=A0ABZ2HNH9_9RHOB